MRRAVKIGGAAAVLGLGVALALSSHLVGPKTLYPNPALTPGLIATQNIADLTATSACGTYSQCHRATSAALKTQVRSEYSGCPSGAGQSEIDHFVPLALGGADDVKNLWCEPLDLPWQGGNYGFKTKDKLENYLVIEVKAGLLAPANAQQCILDDWVACYQKYVANKGSFGAVDNPGDVDGEDIE